MKLIIQIILTATILFSLFTHDVTAQGVVCNAASVQEMSNCVNQLNSGAVSEIEISNRIDCTASLPCNFTITANGGKISGTSPDAGFLRKEVFNRQVLVLNKPSNITISDLKFDDDTGAKCTSSCVAQISVSGTNITLQRLTMNNSKQQAITASGKNLQILNSNFFKSYSQTIWLDSSTDTVLIEGNTIRYGGGSGTFVRGKNITIKNNTYERNQWNTPWIVQGGQVYFNGGWDDGVQPVPESAALDNLTFTGNKIINGYYYRFYTAGIELSGMIRNATINGNYIHNNTASGIVSHTTRYFSNVIIEGNEITKNKSGVDDLENRNNWTLRDNCFTEPCNIFPKPGDLNNDGSVNTQDFDILKANFGKTGPNTPGDFNSNGKVDVFDYNTFMTEYQKIVTPPTPTPTPTKIVISRAGVNTSGAYATNWAVWASVSKLGPGNNLYALLIKPDGKWWGPLAPIFINSARTGISFFLPSAYPVGSECNLTASCTVKLILVNYDTLADSNEYTLTIPKKTY